MRNLAAISFFVAGMLTAAPLAAVGSIAVYKGPWRIYVEVCPSAEWRLYSISVFRGSVEYQLREASEAMDFYRSARARLFNRFENPATYPIYCPAADQGEPT